MWNIVKNNDQGKVRGFKVFNNREEVIGFNELSSIPKKAIKNLKDIEGKNKYTAEEIK